MWVELFMLGMREGARDGARLALVEETPDVLSVSSLLTMLDCVESAPAACAAEGGCMYGCGCMTGKAETE